MFRPRKYTPGDKWPKRSPAQQAATQRSFRIFRLRGFWNQAGILTGRRKIVVQSMIDQELTLMGAEPEQKRRAALDLKYEIDAFEVSQTDP